MYESIIRLPTDAYSDREGYDEWMVKLDRGIDLIEI
jgi:hypothetical protein